MSECSVLNCSHERRKWLRTIPATILGCFLYMNILSGGLAYVAGRGGMERGIEYAKSELPGPLGSFAEFYVRSGSIGMEIAYRVRGD